MVLDYLTIIKTSVLLVGLILICTIDIFLYVRITRFKYNIIIHLINYFAIIGLFCFLLDVISLGQNISILISYGIFFCILSGVMLLSIIVIQIVKGNYLRSAITDYRMLFQAIEDLALIFDYNGKLVDINHKNEFFRLFGDITELQELMEFIGIESLENSQERQVHIHIKKQDEYFLLIIHPINSKNTNLGTILVLHDITEIKKSELEILDSNETLQEANAKLLNYVNAAEVLETEKERLRLLKHIQANLITYIENIADYIYSIEKSNENYLDYKEKINKASDMIRIVYGDIRKSIRNISTGEQNDTNNNCG